MTLLLLFCVGVPPPITTSLVAVFVASTCSFPSFIKDLVSVKHEQRVEADRQSPHHDLLNEIEAVREHLAELEDRLRVTSR